MTVKRLIGIIFIFICTFIAWMILGAVNLSRTGSAYNDLRQDVRSLYGDALKISAPTLQNITMEPYTVSNNNVLETHYSEKKSDIELTTQKVDVQLHLDRRKKGTLWFPTFTADFKATYEFEIPEEFRDKPVNLYSPLGNNNAIYTDINISVNGKKMDDITPFLKQSSLVVDAPGKKLVMKTSYHTTGMDEMSYLVTPNYESVSQIQKLDLTIHTDFKDYDFVPETLSPTYKKHTAKGYDLVWNLKNAVTGKDIGVVIPNKLNPGEILSRVTFFAPVPLLFFFFIVMVISILKKIPIHPMHYFFLATAFFAFHLIFSYYSDIMNIYLAFIIASVVSMLLTATYLRLFTPRYFALVIAPAAQLIYLIIFSFSFFFKGVSGIIGATFAVLTLAVMMQLTGKLNWEEVFNSKKK
ncbi:MAG: inner membrane CreD family protein [Deltaproteobacteria bacterium]|nr:inner membrane CreD family protein [Deltaproteobacteria bacterium]